MKATKRFLAVALVVVLLFSVVSVSASAVVHAGWGKMIPTNDKFTQQLSTVNLYGRYDYLNFTILNGSTNYGYFFYEIYADAKYQKQMAYGGFACEGGPTDCSALVDLKNFKNGTYYAISYEAKMRSDGSYSIDEDSIVVFKIKVNRTTDFSKQKVVLKSVASTVDGPVVKWNKLSGATKYVVYRRYYGSSSWTKVGTTTSTSFMDKSVKNTTRGYIYTVKAFNKNNTASRYHFDGVRIIFVGVPRVKSIKLTENDYTITWNKIENSQGYYIYRKSEGGKWTKLAELYSDEWTSYVDKKAKVSGTKYTYTVKAIGAYDGVPIPGKYIESSPVVYVKAPTVTSIATTSDNAIVVKWSGVKNSTYTIYRKVEGTGWTVLAKNYNGTTFTDKTAKKDGTEYIYTVRATQKTAYGNVQGHFVASDGFAFTAMPENIVVSTTETGVKLVWDNVATAKSYTVYSKNIDDSGSWTKIGVSDANILVDNISGIGGSRIYTVRAEGEKSRGSYSGSGVVYFNPEAPELTVTGENGKYTIFWNAVEGADNYAVYKKVDGGEWTLMDTTSANSCEDELAEDGIYSYSVVALKGAMRGMFDDIGYSVTYVK